VLLEYNFPILQNL